MSIPYFYNIPYIYNQNNNSITISSLIGSYEKLKIYIFNDYNKYNNTFYSVINSITINNIIYDFSNCPINMYIINGYNSYNYCINNKENYVRLYDNPYYTFINGNLLLYNLAGFYNILNIVINDNFNTKIYDNSFNNINFYKIYNITNLLLSVTNQLNNIILNFINSINSQSYTLNVNYYYPDPINLFNNSSIINLTYISSSIINNQYNYILKDSFDNILDTFDSFNVIISDNSLSSIFIQIINNYIYLINNNNYIYLLDLSGNFINKYYIPIESQITYSQYDSFGNNLYLFIRFIGCYVFNLTSNTIITIYPFNKLISYIKNFIIYDNFIYLITKNNTIGLFDLSFNDISLNFISNLNFTIKFFTINQNIIYIFNNYNLYIFDFYNNLLNTINNISIIKVSINNNYLVGYNKFNLIILNLNNNTINTYSFNYITSIYIDINNIVYFFIFNTGINILNLNTNQFSLLYFNLNQLNNPTLLTFDYFNNIYVFNSNTNIVLKYDQYFNSTIFFIDSYIYNSYYGMQYYNNFIYLFKISDNNNLSLIQIDLSQNITEYFILQIENTINFNFNNLIIYNNIFYILYIDSLNNTYIIYGNIINNFFIFNISPLILSDSFFFNIFGIFNNIIYLNYYDENSNYYFNLYDLSFNDISLNIPSDLCFGIKVYNNLLFQFYVNSFTNFYINITNIYGEVFVLNFNISLQYNFDFIFYNNYLYYLDNIENRINRLAVYQIDFINISPNQLNIGDNNLFIYYNDNLFNTRNITVNVQYNINLLTLIDTRVINYKTILNSLYNNVYYILIDYDNDTFDSLIYKIQDLNILQFYSCGIINNNYIFDTYKFLNSQLIPSIILNLLLIDSNLITWNEILNFFKNLNLLFYIGTIDLIIPNIVLNNLLFQIQQVLNITINYSSFQLGGSFWILNTQFDISYNLIDLYFYNSINSVYLYSLLYIIVNPVTKYYDNILFNTPTINYIVSIDNNNYNTNIFSLSGTLNFTGTYLYAINVGNYSIIPYGYTSTYYLINYIQGILTILPNNLYITINESIIYGYTYINLNVLYLGLAYNENFNSFNFTNSNIILTEYYGVGNYLYTLNNITSTNYNIVFIPGNIIVNPNLLYIIAINISKIYDNQPFYSNPLTDIIINGFVYNDNISSLSGSINISGNSQGAIIPGKYDIIISGYYSINYNIIYYPGILTIYSDNILIKGNDFIKFYN